MAGINPPAPDDQYQGKKMPRKTAIDEVDQQIIALLQQDGRLSNTRIARTIGTSEGTVRTRLNRLIEEKYIQIVAVSNPLKLGYEAVGNLKIRVDVKKIQQVTRELCGISAIWFIVHTTGEADIYAEFVAESIESLNDLLYQQIYKIDGLISVESSLILGFAKRDYAWGVAGNNKNAG